MKMNIINRMTALLGIAFATVSPLLIAGCYEDPWDKESEDDSYWYEDTEYEMKVIDDPNLIDKYKVDEFETTISFETGESSEFNNKILGVNCGTQTGADITLSLAYNHANQQAFVNNLDPSLLRFPLGVYANFYDWRYDTRFMECSDDWTADKNGSHGSSCVQRDPNDDSTYWKSDLGYTTTEYLSFPNLRNGVEGLATLQKSMGFELLWVWSVSYDQLIDGVDDTDRSQRYDYYVKELNVPVSYVELGNELFFMSQRSKELMANGCTATSASGGMEHINTKRIYDYAEELRAAANEAGHEAPKFALPMSWRGRGSVGVSHNDNSNSANNTHTYYNKAMMFPDRSEYSDVRYQTEAPTAANQDWYDAFVLHKYVGAQPDGSIGDGNEMADDFDASYDWETQLQVAYESRLLFQDELRYYQEILPDGVTKPIWLTEWGVTCGMYAASYLSMADAYLYLFERPAVEIATWFQTHGLNNLYTTSGTSTTYTHTKTGYGAVFETLNDTFRDSKLYETEVDSKFVESGEKVMITDEVSAASKEGDNYFPAVEGVEFVTARALEMADGTTAIYIVNKSNRDVRTKIVIDGEEYTGSYTQEQIAFDELLSAPTWAELDEVTTMSIYSEIRGLIIKPYSVTIITDILL